MPVASNYPDLNVAQESKNPSTPEPLSPPVRLRQAYPALSTDPDILVAINFSADARTVTLSDFTKVGTVQLSTLTGAGSARPWNPAQFHLEPDEAIVVALPNGEAGR